MTDIFFHGKGDWFIKTDNGIRPITSKAIQICDGYLEDLESRGVDISYTNISLRHCDTFSAVFKLTSKDEEAYSISKSKKILKKRLVKLLPSSQPGSSFLDFVEKGLLSIDDIDNCYFIIQDSIKHSQEESAKDIGFKLKILKTDNPIEENIKERSELKPKNLKRIKDLSDFRLELSKDKIPLDTTKPMHIPCTQPMILEALKVWSEKKGRKKDCIWKSLTKGMDQKLWESPERKAIFTALTQGDKDIDTNFFKK